ncbi:MAG TPA: sn-glycerol-3-phosphate ABC transporter ATP-binding protein UgpC [Acidimicrobiales bacterium]|nr:sn-glycerol-3-phosphate ABC transporter ATP-binding protein UgpC [Acidimicrobiales bacterium]
MTSVSLDKVSKVYPNGFEAVYDLDLEIDDGELMVVVGPSGCGKTTVLRMIAGLEDITTGVVRFGERVVNDVPPKDRDVAMVFQSYALYPQMTVAQNIGFALKMKKIPKQEIEKRVRDAASVLGLTAWLDRKPTQLSGGQRQRVAMGRAIVRNPSVFLMDEPLSNLDAKLRVQLRAEISRVQQQIGVATLYVTHDQTEAMTLGHRVAVLRDGVLQQCDAPQVLYDRPKNVFVAGFIGSPAMNLFEGTLSSDLRLLTLGSQSIPLSPAVSERRSGLRKYAGQRIVVGIRPEDLPAANAARPGSVLVGDVHLVEALGAEILVHFRMDAPLVQLDDTSVTEDGDEILVNNAVASSECVARIEPRHTVRAGDRFSFSVSEDRIEFFDLETGLAILE